MQLRIGHVVHTSPALLIGVRRDGVLVYLAVLDDKRPRADVARHVRHLRKIGHEVEERPRACADLSNPGTDCEGEFAAVCHCREVIVSNSFGRPERRSH